MEQNSRGFAADIARDLGLARQTVNNHTKAIFRAFGVTSRAGLTAIFVVPPRIPTGEDPQ